MAIRPEREYRNLGTFQPIETTEEKSDYIVEGYASTFEPYKLFEFEGVEYFERIEPTAFDSTDMSDVVFLRDHTGKVLARTKNDTIQLNVDSIGLHTRTDLGLTPASREMHEDIEVRNYTQMSFSFVVADGGDYYDEATHTRVIKSIRKLYDISAVAFPANPGTDIGVSMRDYFNGAIEAARAERLEAEKRERQKQKIRILMEVL